MLFNVNEHTSKSNCFYSKINEMPMIQQMLLLLRLTRYEYNNDSIYDLGNKII